MKRSLRISILCALPALLGGAMSTQLLAAQSAAESVSVSDPYVREMPPGQPNSAAFMKLRNDSAAGYAVVSAESGASRIVELHTHTAEGGVMKMRRIDKIVIPAQGETTLQPGGLHVMLLGLKGDLKEGGSVSITLVFDDGSKKAIQAPVRKLKM